jgi:hypothetical protein
VRDRDGQQLAYVHFDNPRAAAKPSPLVGYFRLFRRIFAVVFRLVALSRGANV